MHCKRGAEKQNEEKVGGERITDRERKDTVEGDWQKRIYDYPVVLSAKSPGLRTPVHRSVLFARYSGNSLISQEGIDHAFLAKI